MFSDCHESRHPQRPGSPMSFESSRSIPSFDAAENNVIVVPSSRRNGGFSRKNKVLQRLLFVDDDKFLEGSEFLPKEQSNAGEQSNSPPINQKSQSFDAERHVSPKLSPDSSKMKPGRYYGRYGASPPAVTDSETDSTTYSFSEMSIRSSPMSSTNHQIMSGRSFKGKPIASMNQPYPRRQAGSSSKKNSKSALSRLVDVLESTPSKLPHSRSRSTGTRRASPEVHKSESISTYLENVVVRRRKPQHEAASEATWEGTDMGASGSQDSTSTNDIRQLAESLVEDLWSLKSSRSTRTAPSRFLRSSVKTKKQKPKKESLPAWAHSFVPKKEPSYEKRREMQNQRVHLACLIANAVELERMNKVPKLQRARSSPKVLQQTLKKSPWQSKRMPTPRSSSTRSQSIERRYLYKEVASTTPLLDSKRSEGSRRNKRRPSLRRRKSRSTIDQDEDARTW